MRPTKNRTFLKTSGKKIDVFGCRLQLHQIFYECFPSYTTRIAPKLTIRHGNEKSLTLKSLNSEDCITNLEFYFAIPRQRDIITMRKSKSLHAKISKLIPEGVSFTVSIQESGQYVYTES